MSFVNSPGQTTYNTTLDSSGNTHIDVADIDTKIAKLINNGSLKQQFKQAYLIRDGQCDYALIAANIDKNRYGRYGYGIPYDNNRVVLNIQDNLNSKVINSHNNNTGNTNDYINASYIDGYDSPGLRPGRYIACQGPQPDTVADMWRMISQTGCQQIVNLVKSRGKQDWHCSQYWPDSVGTTVRYGPEITVKTTDIEVSPYGYTVRTFELQCEGWSESREVIQYNYTVWPDWGVPDEYHSFVAFIKCIRDSVYYKSVNKPIVVHCSAGIGRTGSFILIDLMLEMAGIECGVDPFRALLRLRRQRMNLVEAYEQYVFVHQVLRECLK